MQFLMKRRKEEAPFQADRGSVSATFHSGPPEIAPQEIEKLGVLGDGSFGTVYKGRCRSQDVAVKVLHKQDMDEHTLNAFRKEAEIVSRIFHPNILLYMGACTIPGHMAIITELMPRGDLESMLHDKKHAIPLLTRMQMARDAAKGMTWLHSSNPVFIHRDLKTSNLLVADDYTIKLCDFGLSQIKQRGENLLDGAEGAKGTPLWMAPEVMAGDQFNEKADVYSYGIVLWEILTRDEPFAQFENYEEFRDAICNKHVRPPIPQDSHPGLRQLIEACWHANPPQRPDFHAIVAALEYIIVDTGVQDAHGRKLWKDHFLKEDRVKWLDFLRTFSTCLPPEPDTQVKLLNMKCLHALLAEKGKNNDEEIVTLSNFGNFLNFFGPMVVHDPAFMEHVRQMLKKPYFHGDITTQDAEAHLTGKAAGTFLLRFSSSAAGSYTISKVHTDHSINHQRIIHYPGQGGYYINNRAYATLDDLLKYEARELHLITPCLGSRFSPLFSTQSVTGYLQ
eukprot:TRINITY_DN3403_c2_g1_i1.p1 TRINITY_DN3403_c2_g1~~TRINITY_DN3403_c2_g1_i1.p1  ORF type:complete len:506 (+),score=76.69 TRINITY_DN3403_c2_g1_i1:215-1732(+)